MLLLCRLEVTMSSRSQCTVSSIRADAASPSSGVQFNHGTLHDKAA